MDVKQERARFAGVEAAVAVAVHEGAAGDGEDRGRDGQGEAAEPGGAAGVRERHGEGDGGAVGEGERLQGHAESVERRGGGARREVAVGGCRIGDENTEVAAVQGADDAQGGLGADVRGGHVEGRGLVRLGQAVAARSVEPSSAAVEDVRARGRDHLEDALVGQRVEVGSRDRQQAWLGERHVERHHRDAAADRRPPVKDAVPGESDQGPFRVAFDDALGGTEEQRSGVGGRDGRRHRRPENERRVAEEAPRVHHLLAGPTVGLDHRGTAVEEDAAEAVADAAGGLVRDEEVHFVLAFHGRGPTLEHAGKRPSDAADRGAGRVHRLAKALAEAVAAALLLVKIAHAAPHDDEEGPRGGVREGRQVRQLKSGRGDA